MNTQPLISICITCYNAQDTIGPAIEGALKQTWENKEIIIVDDKSSDQSSAIIQTYTDKFPFIKLVKHEVNQGYPTALNSFLDNAQGEFVAIFDDDDVSDENRLKKQVGRLCDYEEKIGRNPLVFCYTNRYITFPGEPQRNHMAYAIGRTPTEPHGQAATDFFLWGDAPRNYTWGMLGSCTLLTRKSTFKQLGPFDTNFRRYAEWDMAVRASMQGTHFIAVNEPVITMTKTMTSDKAGKKPLQYALKLCRKYKPYLQERGLYQSALIMVYAKFYRPRSELTYLTLMGAAALLSPRKILLRRLTRRIKHIQHEKSQTA